MAADTRLIVLEDLVTFTSAVNDYDDQYFVVTLTPVLEKGDKLATRVDGSDEPQTFCV